MSAYAAFTTSARTAVAHSSTSRSYSALASPYNQPPQRVTSARMSSFTTAAGRTEPEGKERGDMPRF